MHKLVIASNNKYKIKEIKQILDLENFEILDLNLFPDIKPVIEDGLTLEENAIKKALEVFHVTRELSMADDTGLFVDYLLGAPGIISARYAGDNVSYEENNRKLLSKLKGVPPRRRTARFKSCLAIIGKDFKETVEGVIEGKILFEPRGKNGFGYDPLFLPNGFEKTLAEMNDEEKNSISHRYHSLKKAKLILENLKI